MIFLYAFVLLLLIVVPLYVIYRRVKSGRKSKRPLIANLCAFFGLMLVGAVLCFGQPASAADAAAASESLIHSDGFATGMGYLSAALAVGVSGVAGAMAVTASASAAIGAISENESVFGKCLIFVGLAEGIALYGLLIGFMIISKL